MATAGDGGDRAGTRRSPRRLTRRGRRRRVALKRFVYSQLALRSAVLIALGREQPLVRFTVEHDPPSVYLVFAVRPEALDRLRIHLDLPAGLALAPIRCLAGDEPRLLLVVNVYRVSGITNGRRAEWSVFVTEPDGTTRYLVVDARSSSRSMDPVDVLTPAGRVEHVRTGDRVVTAVGRPGAELRATVDLAGASPTTTAPEWVTANDRIYWRNGVRDRTFYDAGLADARAVSVAPDAVTVSDTSPWAGFVEPEPVVVLAFTEAIEFVVSPWENVEDLST